MDQPAKVTMLLCAELRPSEQEKVERLDSPIFMRFASENLGARFCKGIGSGSDRVLEFSGAGGIVGTVNSADFLSAPDDSAVEMIVLAK